MAETVTPDIMASMERSLIGAVLQHDGLAGRYDQTRAALRAALIKKDVGEGQADDLIEAFERGWYPGYGDGADPASGNVQGRRTYDQAMRNHVGDALFTRFVTALRQQRQASSTVNRLKERSFSVLGPDRLDRVTRDTERLNDLRGDILTAVRNINPEISADVAGQIVGENQDYDPVRRVATIALDPGRGTAPAYKAAWASIENLLTDKERSILAEAIDGRYPGTDERDRPARMAEMFVEWAAPSGRQKPDSSWSSALKPFKTFFARVRNASSQKGFRSVEDVWRAAASGEIAKRQDDSAGLQAEDPKHNPNAHTRMKQAVAKMTGAELADALRVQNAAIFEARKASRRLLMTSQTRKNIRRRMHRLLRTRTMIEAEQRHHFDTSLSASAEAAGLPPDPAPGGPTLMEPGPGGPDGGQSSTETAMSAAWQSANDNGSGRVSAGLVEFDVNTKSNAHGEHYVVSMIVENTHDREAIDPVAAAAGRPSRTEIAMSRNRGAVTTYMDAFDRANATGGASRRAQELAARASSTDRTVDVNADIRLRTC